VTQIGTLSYVLPPAVAAIVGVIIAAIVASWAPASRSRRAFFVMATGLVIWALSILGMRMSHDIHVALIWDRSAAAAIMVMFLGFYHFSLEYSGPFRRKHTLVVSYLLVAGFALASALGLLVEDLRIAEYGYAPVPGILAIPASATALALLACGVYVLLRRYLTTSSYEERNRLLFLMIGASLPLVGTLIDIFTDFPPVGIWTNILFCIVTAIALLEYRLLDIPCVARRTLTYLLLGVMVALPYVITVFVLHKHLGTRLESFWGYVILVLLLALLLRPLYTAASELVDRLFFRERYDALRALQRFGEEAHHSVNLTELGCRLTRLVTDALHSSCTCLFLPSEGREALELFHCEGLQHVPRPGSLRADGTLIRWLESHPEVLVHRMLKIEPLLQGLSSRERELLDAVGAHLLVPMTSPHGSLAGLLILGPKYSAREYSGEDRHLLEVLSNQMAIALENARLYSGAVRARRDLEHWLNGMEDSIIIFGPSRRVKFLNSSAQKRLQLQPGDPCSKVLSDNGQCNACTTPICTQGAGTTIRTSRNIGQHQYDLMAAQLTDPDGRISILCVLRDVTERNQIEEELRRSRERMRELAAHLESAREQERAGIARELHDELGQALTALKMDLSWLSRHDREAPSVIHEKVGTMMSMVDSTIRAVQRISSELRPGVLDDLGLTAALEWLARTFEEKSGIPCDIELDETVAPDGTISTALFRVCQESLTNVARHSGATRARLSLKKEPSHIVLAISDNGRGVTAEETESAMSFGFIGMRERVRSIGGMLSIDGVQGRGTTIEVTLPLEQQGLQ